MSKRTFTKLVWKEVSYPRPFDEEKICEILSHIAVVTPRGPVILEARSHGGYVKHFIDADTQYITKLENTIKAHGDIQFYSAKEHQRAPVGTARQLTVSHPGLTLKTETTSATIRAGLAALAAVRGEEESVVQVILGKSFKPQFTPKFIPDPDESWLRLIMFGVDEAPTETRKSIKEKNEQYCFEACIRIGASGENQVGRVSRINNIFDAFRTLESAGVRTKLIPEKAPNLNFAKVPWHFPLRLSVKELTSFTLLPFGEEELPGTIGLHPRLTLPPKWYREPTNRINDRTFANSINVMGSIKLSIDPESSLEHLIVTGPTGSGKSTILEHLILSDIYAGRGVLVIDPKQDLINRILECAPESRQEDIVVIDPSDPCPVGFNPFALPGDKTLIADAILAVFKEVFAENWGIRSQDILSAALLTLAQTKDASLLWLPALLTNEKFRHSITDKLTDEIVLKPFWKNYDAMRDSERRTEIAPVLNKIRQFLYRPGLRNILGQSNPKFQLTDLFYKRKIILVPLNKGTIGAESARLLGSLIVGLTWTLALSRANIPAYKRHIISLYIDELQDYLALPTDLSDALAQARGLGVGITMAHQYRAQLPPDIRAGIDANARSKIVFGLNATDAKEVAAMAPELDALDFMTLPRYEVYANFMSGGKATGWIRGVTMPPMEALRSPAEFRAVSQASYGIPHEDTERDFLKLLRSCEDEVPPDIAETSFGRRKS